MMSKAKKFPAKSLGIRSKLISLIIKAMSKTGFFCVYGFLRSRMFKHLVPIIAYHRVSEVDDYPWSLTPVTPKEFEQEIRYLSHKYHIISLDDLVTYSDKLKTLPPKTAVVTFDDGYKDTYRNAYPILKKYRIPATVFLTTGHIGTGKLFWWDKVGYVIWKTESNTIDLGELGIHHLNSASSRLQMSNTVITTLKQFSIKKRDELINGMVVSNGVDIPPNLGEKLILSWDEIKEMSKNGISFGAHTVSHPILSRLSLEAASKEILDSKKHIEKELGQEVTTFCYPNGEPGDFSGDIEGILKSNGFKCAITLSPAAFVSPTSRIYELPRIPGTTSFDKFKLVTSGLYTDLYPIWSLLRR
jgi:peptidoglycan/xylan/chitin deacetylase (PgdA/CDA1 family)